MATEHDAVTDPGSGASTVAPRPSQTPTDELRDRMRLRLARSHAHGAADGSASSSERPGGPRSDGNPMVWKSVVGSLSPDTDDEASAWAPRLGFPQASAAVVAEQAPAPVVAVPAPVVTQPAVTQPAVTQPAVTQSAVEPALSIAATAVVDSPVEPAPVVPSPVAEPAAEPAVAPVVVPTIVPATPSPVVAEPESAPGPATAAAPSANPDPMTMIVPSIPVISQPSRAAAAVRPARPLLDQTSPVVPTHLANRTHGSKRKRRPFRAFFAFLVVASMLGGAGYAGWYFFLRDQASWSAELEPTVTIVEEALGRSFDDTVPVVTLSTAEYEIKLGMEVVDWSYGDPDNGLLALRAVGLAGPGAPAVVAASVGHIAAASYTSFYRAEDRTIYRLEGDTPLFTYGLARSLAVALTDQQVGWSSELDELTDAQRVGLRAIVDGVAADVFHELMQAETPDADAAGQEFVERAKSVGLDVDRIPLYATMAIVSANTGGSTGLQAAADDPIAAVMIPPSDAVVFDVTRDPDAIPVEVTAVDSIGPRTLGMQFWYETLVPVLGIDAARDAALLWAGDASVVSMVNNVPCIRARIATANDTDQNALSSALMQWAQSRPASSTAMVVSEAGNITSVSACEAVEGGTDAVGTLEVGQLFSRAVHEREVTTAMVAAGLPDTAAARNCAVIGQRSGALLGYDPENPDPALAVPFDDIIRFCSG